MSYYLTMRASFSKMYSLQFSFIAFYRALQQPVGVLLVHLAG